MFKLFAFLLLLTVITAKTLSLSNDVDGDVQLLKSSVYFVKSISEARQLFPNVNLTPLSRATSDRGNIHYVLGKRIAGDRLVAHGSDNRSWASLHDITLNLRYPQSGSGAVITYIDILVGQSSNIGQAYLVSGGIGQRLISIVIEAKSTLWFRYNAEFYGI